MPVPPDRAENAQHEGVVQRLDLMRHAGSDVKHFAFPQRQFLAGHEQLERALQHVRHLLALMGMLWHNRAALQIGDSRLMLNDEFPEFGACGPTAAGASPAPSLAHR